MKTASMFVGLILSAGVMLAADAAAGEKVYGAKCKSCHGADGKGNPSIAKMMKVELKALGSAEVKGKPEADLKKTTLNGTGKMKGVRLTDAEWSDLYAFWKAMK